MKSKIYESKIRNNNQKESEEKVEVTDAEEMVSNWDQIVDTFDEIGLKRELLRGMINFDFRDLWIWI
jgi:hypothetical protein